SPRGSSPAVDHSGEPQSAVFPPLNGGRCAASIACMRHSTSAPPVVRPMARAGVLGDAGIGYASFVVAAVWAIGFLANVAAPQTVDRPGRPATWFALLVDAGLLALFAVQHTVMARRGFKERFTRHLPASAERSTYVLAAGLLLILLFWQWQPVPIEV